jgi:hypothetical protein
MSDRCAWLSVACPACGAAAGARCGGWHWTRGGRARWLPDCRLHPGRGWRERSCQKCGAWPGYPCLTPRGRESARLHTARLEPARAELFHRKDVWEELDRRAATIAKVPFSGRAGTGGQTGRIVLLRPEGDDLIEVESWSSRDELCFALEAPLWARLGSFAGHPLINGEVRWRAGDRVVELIATRGGRRFEERLA